MALVLMATHGWGTLFVDPADLEAGVGLQSSFTNPADATAATHYANAAGGSPSTGPVTADANGRLMRYIEEGTYTQALPGGATLEVHAVSGATVAAVARRVTDLHLNDYLPSGFISGTTDATAALQSWFLAAQAIGTAKGSVRLRCAAGTYKFTSVLSGYMGNFSNFDGFEFDCGGAVFADQRSYSAGQTATCWRFGNISNIKIRARFTSEIPNFVTPTLPPGFAVMRFHEGCRGIDVDLETTGCREGVSFVRLVSDPLSYKSGDAKVNVRSTDTFYPFGCQYSGDNVEADINAMRPGRGWIVYGCKNVRINAHVQDQVLESAVASYPDGSGIGVEDLEVFHSDTGSTVFGTCLISIQYIGHTTPITHKNMRFKLEISSPGTMGILIRKIMDDVATPDTTGRGHVLDGFQVSGTSEITGGVVSDHVQLGVGFGEFVTPDVMQGIRLHDLTLKGANGRLYMKAKCLADIAHVDRVTSDFEFYIENQNNGAVVYTACQGTRFSRDATDAHTYVGCRATGTLQAAGSMRRAVGSRGTGMGPDERHNVSGNVGRMWLPSTAKMANIDRSASTLTDVGWLTSGTLKLAPLGMLRAGDTLSALTFWSGGTPAGTPTNHWACIVRVSDRKVKGISPDKTTTAWAANSVGLYTFGTPYTPTEDELLWAGLMVTATTVPGIWGILTANNPMAVATSPTGLSNTGQTTPLALDTVVTAPGGDSKFGYVYAS